MKNKNRLYESTFFTALALTTTENMFKGVINISLPLLIIHYLTLLFLFISILLSFNKTSFRTVLASTFIITLSALSELLSNNSIIMTSMLFIIAARNIDFKKIIKNNLYIKTILLCSVVLLYFIGCTENITLISETRRIRYSLGFTHPNQLAAYLFGIYSAILFLKDGTSWSKKLLLSSTFFIIIWLLTDSRSAEIAIIVLFTFSITPKRIYKNRIIAHTIPLLFWLATALSLFLTINISDPTIRDINKVLSGRLSLQSAFLTEYGIKPLGNHFTNYRTVHDTNSAEYILDSAYMQLLIRFGYLITICFGLLYSKSLSDAIKKTNRGKIAGLVAFLAFGLMETGLFYPHQNPFLFSLLTNDNGGAKCKNH